MLFAWISVALLLLVLAAICAPLLFGTRVLPARGQYDRAVYRDQLLEVDRDLARGVLGPDEAGAARLEIQRRLLAVDRTGDEAATGGPSRSPIMAALSAVFVIVVAGGMYWRLGAPGIADTPFAEQTATPAAEPAAPHTDLKQAAERLRQKLRTDPSNAGGWVLYARTTSMLGDWQTAADAYNHALSLGLKSADVLSGFGEMQVMAADGIVSPVAREAFTSAIVADAANAVARYYLALADSQAGEERRAIDAWLDLAAGLPEDSPMREEIARRIIEAAKSAGLSAPPMPKGLAAEAPPSGPTAEQMQAAADMSPEQRAEMIGGMIDKLAAKLQREPNDLDGWLRLGQAYVVRGDGPKAVDAFDHAAALKPGDPGIKLHTVAALLTGLKPEDALPPRAIALLNEVATVSPDAPEVLWYLGVIAARDGRPAEAREKWTKLLGLLAPEGEDNKMVRAALAELPNK